MNRYRDRRPSEYYRVGGYRYGIPFVDPIDDGDETLADAVEWSFWQIEGNYASPAYITCPEGRVIEQDEFNALLGAYRKSLEPL